MYYGNFCHFSNLCQNLPKNNDFWPKISDFLNFIAWFSVRIFRRKMHQILGKWSNWPNFCINAPSWGTYNRSYQTAFGYLVFWSFYGGGVFQGGFFWLKLSKKAILAHTGLHKITKTRNILVSYFCSKYPKEHLYTKN